MVVGLHPVGQRRAEVHERVADGRELPVEDADDARGVRRVQDEVVEAEVVVDQHVRPVGRLVRVEPGHRRLEVADVGRAGPAVAAGPALDLAPDVALAAVEPGEPRRLEVDVVQRDQRVDRVAAQGLHAGAVEAELGRQVAAQDRALDALHDVELGAEHVLVAAVRHHLGHEGEHRRERGLEVVLAAHVVRAPGLGAHRRAAQDEVTSPGCRATGIPEQVREVGRAADELPDLGDPVETGCAGGVLAQPRGDSLDVEGVLVAHRCGTRDVGTGACVTG